MIAFPNCKINLGLQVLQKRRDGFHNIETVFYPIPLKDVLEITPAQNAQQPAIHMYGVPLNGEASDNICIKAWLLLKKDFADLPAIEIHLLKNIPAGAGLGGGSADGAFMLQLLSNKFHLGLSPDQLIKYASQLGSDCPFFIINKPCYATGRGELLEPIMLNLSSYHVALANPGIHINTGLAFSQLIVNDSLMSPGNIKHVVAQPVETWKYNLVNDFEKPVFEKYPQIKALKENMYAAGAVYAAMSGSGSTVFGIFEKTENWANRLPAHFTTLSL